MKLVVWDLHGTLEQGNERAVIDISNKVLADHGYAERFSYADNPQLYGRKWYDYFAWLFNDGDHDRDLRLQDACFRLSEASLEMQCRHVRPASHAPEVLGRVRAGHHQILISNTRTATLKVFIDVLGYGEFFSSGNAFAVDGHAERPTASKEDVLAGYLRDADSYKEIIIVGDSPSDMRLKNVAGGITCLYAHPGIPGELPLGIPWRLPRRAEDEVDDDKHALPGQRQQRRHGGERAAGLGGRAPRHRLCPWPGQRPGEGLHHRHREQRVLDGEPAHPVLGCQCGDGGHRPCRIKARQDPLDGRVRAERASTVSAAPRELHWDRDVPAPVKPQLLMTEQRDVLEAATGRRGRSPSWHDAFFSPEQVYEGIFRG